MHQSGSVQSCSPREAAVCPVQAALPSCPRKDEQHKRGENQVLSQTQERPRSPSHLRDLPMLPPGLGLEGELRGCRRCPLIQATLGTSTEAASETRRHRSKAQVGAGRTGLPGVLGCGSRRILHRRDGQWWRDGAASPHWDDGSELGPRCWAHTHTEHTPKHPGSQGWAPLTRRRSGCFHHPGRRRRASP